MPGRIRKLKTLPLPRLLFQLVLSEKVSSRATAVARAPASSSEEAHRSWVIDESSGVDLKTTAAWCACVALHGLPQRCHLEGWALRLVLGPASASVFQLLD